MILSKAEVQYFNRAKAMKSEFFKTKITTSEYRIVFNEIEKKMPLNKN